MRQGALQAVCRDILNGIDGALGCAVVDLETGLTLAFDVRPGRLLNPDAMELLSAAGVTYFKRGTVADSAKASDSVMDIQTTTEDAFHFMSRVPGETELLILVTDRKVTNLGMGWMSMRQALDQVRDVDLYDDAEQAAPRAAASAAEGPADAAEEGVFDMRSRARRTIWD